MVAADCPSRQTLLQYSVGLLPDEQSDELAGHLDSCPDCQATILTLEDAEDTLIGRLRTPPDSEPCLAEPEFQAALAEAIVLPAGGTSGGGGVEKSASIVPQMLGEYRILGELGRGGMGRVYKALHTKLDRMVALKVLPRSCIADHRAIARFEREMKAVGRLAHPNIVQAADAREIDGTPVLIMEFVDGLDLGRIARRLGWKRGQPPFVRSTRRAVPANGDCPLFQSGLPVADACEIARQAALGLQAAHEHGLVHRDIKPSNLMLTPQGQVKLLDLGLARFCTDGEPSVGVAVELPPQRAASAHDEMTGTGQAMGTADYIAPEQAADSRTVDIRADIYSLGATLYRLLSGRAPFSGPEYPGTLDKMAAHRQTPVPAIRQFLPELPAGLVAVLDRMLAKTPEARYSTPSEVAEALTPWCVDADLPSLLQRAVDSDRVSPVPLGEGQGEDRGSSNPLAASRRWKSIVALLVLLLLVGGLGFSLGVMIRIQRDGQETAVEVPTGSTTHIGSNGQVEVTLPGRQKTVTPAAVSDERGIQGTWEVVSSSFSLVKKLPCKPEVAPDRVLKTTKVIITADTLKIVGQDVTDFALQYKLNPVARTKMIDLRTPGTMFGLVSYGIYQFDGNQLRICTSRLCSLEVSQAPDAKSLRPSEFWAEFGSNKELLVLRRVGDAAVTEDEEAIQGTWQVEEAPMAAAWFGFSRNQLVVFSRHGLTTRVPAPSPAMGMGSGAAQDRTYEFSSGYALDPTARPKRIDIATVVCPDVTPLHGIYELEGGRLTIAWAQDRQPTANSPSPGPCPPSKLAAGPDTALVVLKRVDVSDPALKKTVSLSPPYEQSYPDAPTNKTSVQYAVMALAKQAGLRYDFDGSRQNTDPICRQWIHPDIRNQSCGAALDSILTPLGLSYEVRNGTIVLTWPTQFESKPGSDITLPVLERQKPAIEPGKK